MSKITLSVIVAFYNEKGIVKTYRVFSDYLKKHFQSFELIFVDDGSTIDTKDLSRQLKKDSRAKLIRYSPNQGRGYAVTTGFRAAKGNLVLYIDSDLDINISHVLLIVEALKTYDVAIGNKFHPKSRVKTRKIRKIASFIFNSIIRVFLRSKVTDHHVGLKGFRKEVLKTLLPHIRERRWTFDVEILSLAQKKGFTVGYVPIKMTYGMEGVQLSYVRYLEELFIYILKKDK